MKKSILNLKSIDEYRDKYKINFSHYSNNIFNYIDDENDCENIVKKEKTDENTTNTDNRKP